MREILFISMIMKMTALPPQELAKISSTVNINLITFNFATLPITPTYITYRADGNSQSHTNWQNYTDGTHDFDFDANSITITQKVLQPNPQTDWAPLNFHLLS